jgi:hypothetical protein
MSSTSEGCASPLHPPAAPALQGAQSDLHSPDTARSSADMDTKVHSVGASAIRVCASLSQVHALPYFPTDLTDRPCSRASASDFMLKQYALAQRLLWQSQTCKSPRDEAMLLQSPLWQFALSTIEAPQFKFQFSKTNDRPYSILQSLRRQPWISP